MIDSENGYFNFNKYWGPDDYRPWVVFERGSNMHCIYCGETANTREHCPPKLFLNNPYPNDLPVVPSCEKCNNGFSKDELYTKAFIEFYQNYCYNTPITVSLERKEVREAQQTFSNCINNKKIFFNNRIGRILIKLSICHSTYELTEGYYSNTWKGVLECVSYTFRPHMAQKDIDNMNDFILMDNKLLPIIGSRVFNKIYVLDPVLLSLADSNIKHMPRVVMDWSDVQDKSYRYVCWLDRHNLYIRLVIKEFLFAQIVFKKA